MTDGGLRVNLSSTLLKNLPWLALKRIVNAALLGP